MFFAKILIFVIPIVIGIFIFDYIKDYKKNHWHIKCSHCGFTNTGYKNNDVECERYEHKFGWPVKYIEQGTPTFICKYCGKEYGLSEGEWVKNPIIPKKVEENNNEKYRN
ncbi:MAG: hypothetical protein K5681_00585 [Treponema sp.]|nr:hypothetical protein [Treponema sp.]